MSQQTQFISREPVLSGGLHLLSTSTTTTTNRILHSPLPYLYGNVGEVLLHVLEVLGSV